MSPMLPNQPDANDRRLTYQPPATIDVGSVENCTGAIGTPVRDNPNSDNPAYYNANPLEATDGDTLVDPDR